MFDQILQVSDKNPELAEKFSKLVDVADMALARYAGIQQIQSELSGDALSYWNMHSGLIESGRHWKAILGYSRDELSDSIGGWQELAHPRDLKRLKDLIAGMAREKGNTFRTECRMKKKSGEWCVLSLSGKVLSRGHDGNPERIVILQRDISDFKKTESAALTAKALAEEANRTRGAFLANMSHEIRTPMNAIIGMTELTLDTQLNDEQKHYLHTVKTSAESLLTIINDVLDFSKIEAGKMRFEEIAFTLPAAVLEAVRNLAVVAHKKGLELIVDVAPEVPSRLIGDPGRLRQVITNLLSNAIKFTEKGEIRVEVKTDSRDDNAVNLRFSVTDTGIGVPEGSQKAIFEAFSQADDSTTRKFGGTGLGLAICANLVQLMDGKIGLNSEPGKGSTFYFTGRFPFESGATQVADPPSFADQRVLILMENVRVADQMRGFLRRLQCSTEQAKSNEEAHEILDSARKAGKPYSVFMVDGNMPEPGGIGLVGTWKEKAYPEQLLMLLTTQNQRQHLELLRKHNFSIYLVRPTSIDDIASALGKLKDIEDITADEASSSQPQPDKAEKEDWLEAFDSNIGVRNLDEQRVETEELNILLTEDNAINQDLAIRLLSKMGHPNVAIANNGAEAVTMAEKNDYDIIFMDMQMPVMGGLEATENIRSNELSRSWLVADAHRGVPIVAMTANAMEGDRERCLQAGMNDYISKPVRASTIEEVMVRILGNRGKARKKIESDNQAPSVEHVSTQALSSSPQPSQQTPTTTTSDTQQKTTVSAPGAVINLKITEQELGDKELVKRTVSMFLNDHVQYAHNLADAIKAKDHANMQMHSHTIKGLLATFHAEHGKDIALQLEQMAQRPAADINWRSAIETYNALLAQLKAVRPVLQEYIS